MWVDKKLHRDHRDMLNSSKHLKIFQCWNQLELKYNIINALMISLKDAIKSTSPVCFNNQLIFYLYLWSVVIKSQYITNNIRIK